MLSAAARASSGRSGTSASKVVGEDRGFANARGAEIDELVLRWDG
ncbi:hypothetical protein [Streptomyces sp. NPDC051921]